MRREEYTERTSHVEASELSLISQSAQALTELSAGTVCALGKPCCSPSVIAKIPRHFMAVRMKETIKQWQKATLIQQARY